MAHILLVEDDKGIVTNLTEFLQKEGFHITSVDGQEKALSLLEESGGGFDLVLLDVSLAEGNGFAVCRAVKSNMDLPVIFLTASGDEYSVVTGFDLGADDYIAKPFRPRELVSRIHNILRRYGKANAVLEYQGLSVDVSKGTVSKDGHEIVLSALEYRLLLYFMNHKGMVLSRGQLLDALWDIAGEFVNDNTLTVYIKRLREKIEGDPQNPELIKTVRGMGVTVGAVSKWENDVTLPDLQMLCCLADYFGVTTDRLLGRICKGTFMVCDDAPLIRRVLKELLEKEGYLCLGQAEDGAQLRALFEGNIPDILFLDIHFPSDNGLELLKEIKESQPSVKVVMVTADNSEEAVQAAISYGASAFVTKPFQSQFIMAALDTL